MTSVLLTTLAVLVAVLFALWAISVRLTNASIIDPFWGPGFVLVGWTAVVVVGEIQGPLWLLMAMVTVWGLRLGGYLLVRAVHEGVEDRRYVAMRKTHGERFWWVSLGTVFMLQAVLLWLVSLPIQGAVVANSEATLGPWVFVGGLVWLVGFGFEVVGDAQLAAFKKDPGNAGQVLDRGLWSLTRHPNYFGDFCVWWGHFIVAVALGAPLWTIIGPLLMSFLLMKVSGVAMLEKTIKHRRPAYADYIARTSAFFPWPAKDGKSG